MKSEDVEFSISLCLIPLRPGFLSAAGVDFGQVLAVLSGSEQIAV